MDKTLDTNLTDKVIEWVGQAAQQIGDFAAKEVPPFINEYLTWKFWENVANMGFYVMWVLVYVILCTAFYKLAKFFYKKLEETHDSDWESATGLTGFIGIVIGVLGLLYTFISFPQQNIIDCVQIKIAPKVYLVEKATELYKESKKESK